MEVDKLDILKCIALSATGLFAGGSILINVVINPALRKINDIAIARRFWKESFYRAAKWQGLLWTITTVAGGAVWFLDESSYRNLWCIGSSVMATIFPYNILSMMPDANRLLNNTVIKKLGVSWVRTKLDAYDKQHMYRTFVGLFVLGLWLYVMTKP